MALDSISGWVEADAREYVCVRDVHGVVKSLDDSELRRIHNSSGLVTPDRMPLVWAGCLAGADWMRRVYGPQLMLEVCSRSVEHGWSHFFFGAGPGVADELASRLQSRFPGLKVVGTHSPPYQELTPIEIEETTTMLNQSGADFVWVGLSSPKQERWMDQFRPKLDARVIAGVGAVFAIHAGRVPQAPLDATIGPRVGLSPCRRAPSTLAKIPLVHSPLLMADPLEEQAYRSVRARRRQPPLNRRHPWLWPGSTRGLNL